jgi:hypothetical protein
LDRSEIHVHDEFSAACDIDLLGEIFLRRNGSADGNEQDEERIPNSGEHILVDWLKFAFHMRRLRILLSYALSRNIH